MSQSPCEGILKYQDGSKYEGQLKNNKFEGYGTHFRPDGTIRYQGEFKEGVYHGKGIWYHPNGKKWYEG